MRTGNGQYWEEYFIYDVTKSLTGGSGTTFENKAVKIDTDSNFKVIKNTFVATSGRIKMRMRDDASGRYLLKDAIDIQAIAGRNVLVMGLSNSFIPFIWPKPYLISAGATMTVEAADYSGAANTMRLALHGTKVRPGRAPWDREFRQIVPAIYGFSGGAVTTIAGGTAVGRIEIDIDANFLVQKITGVRTGAATVTVSEGARGREWSNNEIHIDNLVGNGAFPNILPNGGDRFLQRGSVLLVNLTDISGIANTIEVNLIGVKLYE